MSLDPARSSPNPAGEITRLVDLAVRGDVEGRNRLFEEIEPRARRTAERIISKQGGSGRLRVTEVIDEVFADMVLTDQSWENRARFYAGVGRRTFQVVVDLLRKERGIRDRTSIVEILIEAMADESFSRQLGRTYGNVNQIERVLSDLIASPSVAGRIMKAKGDPSVVDAKVRAFLREPTTAESLLKHGDNPTELHAALISVLRRNSVLRDLTVIRRTETAGAQGSSDGDLADLGLDQMPEGFRGLTIHSLLTAYEAMEEMDDAYAGKAAAQPLSPPKVDVGGVLQPLNASLESSLPVSELCPRSLNGQIVYLRMIGWSWEEIAEGLGKSLTVVYNRGRSASAFLKEKLGGDFGRVDGVYHLTPPAS